MTHLGYAEAVVAALRDALETDERVHLIGQYFLGVTSYGSLLEPLQEEFADRVTYPPIAELGTVGTAIDAAIGGLRPIVDIGTASFIFQAFAQIVNEAANVHYMSGGQAKVPMIFHFLHGIRGGGAAQHSHSPQAMLWNVPGIEIIVPSTPADVLGLLRTAVRSDNPTAWVSHVRLFESSGEVPDLEAAIPFGVADVKRSGSDVTIVANSLMVQRSLAAAETLSTLGIDVEVIDPRTLVPLDEDAILESVTKTGRLVIADECHRRCGVAAEIAAVVGENVPDVLNHPIRRVTTLDVPVPFSPPLEEYIEPTEAKIKDAVLEVIGENG